MIEVTNLTRAYGDFVAVDDVSFFIPKGQIVGLLGHNGAGKTTIMKVLTGFLEPTDGAVSIAGMDVVTDRLAIQQKIGYLPEHSPLYPEMSVVEYLDYVCELRGVPSAQRVDAIRRAVRLTGLKEKALEQISTLSKGYMQRVGVAQAIIHYPEILILDEATSGLDPAQIHVMRDLIKQLSKEATVIFSTHIMQEVEAICDRVIIIARGKIAADASLAELRSTDRLVVWCSGTGAAAIVSADPAVSAIVSEEISDGGTRIIAAISGSLTDAAARITRSITAQGRELYQIGAAERSLDTVFRQIDSEMSAGGLHVSE